VNHRATAGFWRRYHRLPQEIRQRADKNFELLKANPYHPSLHFKKIGTLWSARVGSGYRALGLDEGDTVQWFWIGTHAEYDKLI